MTRSRSCQGEEDQEDLSELKSVTCVGMLLSFLLENKHGAFLLLFFFHILHLSLSFYVFVSVFTKIFFYFQFLLSYFLLFMSDCKAFTYLLFTIFFEV